MKKLFLFVFLLLQILNYKVYSIDTAAVKYYPLAVGNSWTYSHFWYPYGGGYNYKETVTGTTITNGHFYYIITIRQGISQTTELRRIDSVKNMILIYNNTNPCPWLQNEITGDSIGAHIGDSSKVACGSIYKMDDTSNITAFGLSRKGKTFEWTDHFEHGEFKRFVKDIGYYSTTSYGPFSNLYINLLGCVINGILYGDTSLTGVNQISSNIPDNFSLSQNYPNPFNPTTNIKFQIAKSSNVKLTIYDVIGKEVEILVDKKLEAGGYQADFDGTNLPSGVYYYQLTVNSEQLTKYTETKKMVLIK